MSYDKELTLAKILAIQAGKKILEYYEQSDIEQSIKKDDSPLTAADLAANKIIVENIKKEFPNDAILSEEEKDSDKRLTNERVWIIDPLDGTKEFLNKNGEFTVNIALVENKKPVLGVIYVPTEETIYFAQKGKGAFKKIQEQEKTQLTNEEEESNNNEHIIATISRSHPSQKLQEFLDTHKITSTIAAGSSLKGCFVAEGKADMYPRFAGACEWDIAAMDIIVREAGCIMCNWQWQDFTYNNKDVFISGLLIATKKAYAHIKKEL